MIWKKISDWTYIQMEKTIQPKLEQISPKSYLFKKDIEANSLTIHFNNSQDLFHEGKVARDQTLP